MQEREMLTHGKIYVCKVIILDITWQGTESRKKRKEKPDKIQIQKKNV